MKKNLSIHICDRSHVNISMNVYNCGNRDIGLEQSFCPDHYIFYYVKEGSGIVTQAKISHKIRAGQCFVIFPNIGATMQADPNSVMNVSWVAFSGYLVDRYLMRARLSPYEPLFDDTADRGFEALMDSLLDYAVRPANRYCPIMAQLFLIFTFLLDHAPAESRAEAVPKEMYLLKALDFIDIYYRDNISVEDIAANAGINRKALYGVFKQLTGMSTKDYLISFRMSKAHELLKSTGLPVEAIAASVGYHDQFHFSKEFKKVVGQSPSEYRKMISEHPEQEYHSPILDVRQKFPSAIAE